MNLADQKEPRQKWKGHSGLSSGTLALNGKYVNRTLLRVGRVVGAGDGTHGKESLICISLWGMGSPWWLSGKESACNTADVSLIPGSGRTPGEGNGNSLQYSCLENPVDRGTSQAMVHRVAMIQT